MWEDQHPKPHCECHFISHATLWRNKLWLHWSVAAFERSELSHPSENEWIKLEFIWNQFSAVKARSFYGGIIYEKVPGKALSPCLELMWMCSTKLVLLSLDCSFHYSRCRYWLLLPNFSPTQKYLFFYPLSPRYFYNWSHMIGLPGHPVADLLQ